MGLAFLAKRDWDGNRLLTKANRRHSVQRKREGLSLKGKIRFIFCSIAGIGRSCALKLQMIYEKSAKNLDNSVRGGDNDC